MDCYGTPTTWEELIEQYATWIIGARGKPYELRAKSSIYASARRLNILDQVERKVEEKGD